MRTKTKIFHLGNSFHTWKISCVSESVRTRGMGYGCGHSCRNLHIIYSNVCETVNMAFHVHLGGE